VKLAGKIAVVTGGARGIGAALCERFAKESGKAVVVADLDAAGAEAVAARIGGAAMQCDVSREDDIVRLIDDTESRFGPIDLFCSNAGIAVLDPDWDNPASVPDDGWARSWAVNVMAHVYAARHLVPRMSARGGGYFLHTVSAAGLLSQIGSGPYSATKHAALGFAENLAINVRDRGIKVSVLCPQGVDTPMLHGITRGVPDRDGVLTPEAVADSVINGLDAERFLILPHPEVGTYIRRKADDYDRWLAGMARLRRGM
jgi:NAD(P)-dependent dehydrogenase (short-subunit alcohol dehydrogenase family)